MKTIAATALLSGYLALLIVGVPQTSKPIQAEAPIPEISHPVPKAPSESDAPKFSEIQSLQIQNLNLRGVIITNQIQMIEHARLDAEKEKALWDAEVAKFKSEVEKDHPGWKWDPSDGKWSKVEKK